MKIISILDKIYYNPEKYIQDNSLILLESFMMGYSFFCVVNNCWLLENKEIRSDFEVWVRKEFNIPRSDQTAPEQILRLITKNEKEAYDKFFDLWHSFLKSYDGSQKC